MNWKDYITEKLWDTEGASDLSLKDVMVFVKKRNINAKVTTRSVKTTGGMRDLLTITLKDKKMSGDDYYDFQDFVGDISGDVIRGKALVDVEGRGKEPASVRLILRNYEKGKKL